MPELPDSSMKEAANRIIDLLGDDMDFYRFQDGTWSELISAIKVYIQPRDSSYRRSVRGIEIYTNLKGFASSSADIRKGDRTAIDDTYYVINALENRGTHLEFSLKQTDEIWNG
jgi:hypothetical protein